MKTLLDISVETREIIHALIPAAGMSSSMRIFKPLLPLRGKTVIEYTVGNALNSAVSSVTVVTGYRSTEVESVLMQSFGSRVRFAANEAYETTDMMESLRIGLGVSRSFDAFFLIPADMPAISHQTFSELLAARRQSDRRIILPVYRGEPVHPPLIDAAMIPSILAFHKGGGLEAFLNANEAHILRVEIQDEGSLLDLDTYSDYQDIQNY